MSERAPDRVLAAAAASDLPTLLYDLPAIAARIDAIAAIARRLGVTVLGAAKALAVPEVLALAARGLDGLDLAGPDEDVALERFGVAQVSVTFPGGATAARLRTLTRAGRRVIVSCETAAQVAAAAEVPGVEVMVRLSTSALGDLAPGGIRGAGGDHVSRFGAAADELAGLCAIAPARVCGLHLHGGPLAVGADRLAERARAALALADAAGLRVSRLDLGGSLHGYVVGAGASGQVPLEIALAAARAVVPSAIELCVEPGRVLTEGCGYGAGAVLAARTIDGQPARVLALSRLCHLRWSTPRLCGPPAPRGAGVRVVLLGATCCEDDVIGDAVVADLDGLAVGGRAIVAGISGYAAAWNRGFAGVPAARVIAVE